MHKLILLSLVTLFVTSAQAEVWFDYDFRGTCVGEVVEGVKPALNFYSQELDSNTAVDGVVTIEGRKGNRVEHVAAMKASFTADSNYDSVTVVIKNQPLVIPFGKDVVVKDQNGKKMVCNLKD